MNKTKKKFNVSEVRRYWKGRAKRYGLSHEASWADLPMIKMEMRQILQRLEEGDRVLDAGCGNGFSTVHFASEKNINIRGVDLIPEMIKNAQKRLRRNKPLSKKVEFGVGDITALQEADNAYDKVVAVRVFINLVRASNRKAALSECARVLKPGGRLILSEAMLEGWQRLNKFRKEWKLEAIPMPAFNEYLKEKELLRLSSAHFRLLESFHFSSTYYVGTRVLKPLFSGLLKTKNDPGQALTHWNRWFSHLPSWGDYGAQKLFVFEKK